MSYKNDSYLVIANKFGSASGDAKAQLFETYDKLRDLTVSGSGSGTGFEMTGNFLYRMASLIAPSSFATVFGASESMNIPGTSYASQLAGSSAFGTDALYNYSGFPGGGAAPVLWGLGGYATGGASSILSGWGTDNGVATGYASGVAGIADIASAAAYGVGTANGFGMAARNLVLPIAGVISGWGGIMQAAAPYLGEYGLPAMVMGNLMQGTSSAALSAYQNVTGKITANADVILSNKVRNIETVCKMLDTQSDIVRKMLKDDMESKSKQIDEL